MEPITPILPKWSLPKKFSTLFMAVFFLLQFVDFIISFEILGGFITGFLSWYGTAWEWVIKWTGKTFFISAIRLPYFRMEVEIQRLIMFSFCST